MIRKAAGRDVNRWLVLPDLNSNLNLMGHATSYAMYADLMQIEWDGGWVYSAAWRQVRAGNVVRCSVAAVVSRPSLVLTG
jgi:hypothetical protein